MAVCMIVLFENILRNAFLNDVIFKSITTFPDPFISLSYLMIGYAAIKWKSQLEYNNKLKYKEKMKSEMRSDMIVIFNILDNFIEKLDNIKDNDDLDSEKNYGHSIFNNYDNIKQHLYKYCLDNEKLKSLVKELEGILPKNLQEITLTNLSTHINKHYNDYCKNIKRIKDILK